MVELYDCFGSLGLLECFFGFRFFRLVLAAVGFLIGLQLGVALFGALGLLLMVIEVAVALVVAVLFYFLYFVGFLIAGLGLGVSLGALIAANLSLSATAALVVVLISAALGGVLGFLLSKYIIMISTALVGATQMVTAGLLLLLPRQSLRTFPERVPRGELLVATAIVLVLAVLGFIYQFNSSPIYPKASEFMRN